MGLKIDVFPCLSDNYGFLAVDEASGKVACIDTPEAAKIIARVETLGLHGIDYILNTHWHPDHGGGNAAVKAHFGCEIWGPEEVLKRWPLDHIVTPGDVFMLGETRLDSLGLKGHTDGLIAWLDRAGHNAFIADILFPLGCGRMFEGTQEEYWQSLLTLCGLPDDTVLYSAHEYTLSNLKFAESLGQNPGKDAALEARAEVIRAKRERGDYTVPSKLAEEKATNPFLRYPLQEKGFVAQAAKFGALRRAKDTF